MELPKFLSGEELVEHGKRKPSCPLPAKCAKRILPERTWLEKKQVENALELRKKLVSECRVEKRSSLSHAEWRPDMQKAVVSDKKGPYWSYIGHCEDFTTYIHPEEALFLMEINSLSLRYEGVIVSVQQAYSLLLGQSVSLEEYRAYSSLMREGYRLIRHDDSRIYSDTPKVAHVTKNDSSSASKNDSTCVPSTLVSKSPEVSTSKEIALENCNTQCETIDVENDSNTLEIHIELSDKVSSDAPPENVADCSKTLSDRSDIFDSIVDCFGKQSVKVQSPEVQYLPINVDPCKMEYTVCVSHKSSTKKRRRYDSLLYADQNDFKPVDGDSPSTSSSTTTVYNPFSNSFSRGDKANLHPNPFSTYFSKSIKKKTRNNSPRKSVDIIEQQEEIICLTEKQKNQCSMDVGTLLAQMKKFISDDTYPSQKNKKLLQNLIEQYNGIFNENYVLNEDLFLEEENISNLATNSKDEILNLSSDSDESVNHRSNHHKRKSKLNNSVKKKKRKSNVNPFAEMKLKKISNDSTQKSHANQANTANKTIQLQPYPAKTEAILKNWYVEEPWSQPERVTSLRHEINTIDSINGVEVRNWKQVKSLTLSDDCKYSETHQNRDQTDLKEDTIQSIVKPQDCETVSSVLNALQIIRRTDDLPDDKLKISYDVYPPNLKRFKKSDLPIPSYVLIVKNLNSPPIKPQHLTAIRRIFADKISILVSIVSFDSVFFMQMEDIRLPNVDTSEDL